MRARSGYSLIQLLVVITIIGLMATIALVSASQSRAKTRDAKRITDLAQIRQALEQYASDNRGLYPPSPCGYNCNGYYYSTGWGTLQTALTPYLTPLPKDPINNGTQPWSANGLTYAYGNVQTEPSRFDLVAQLEDGNNSYRCGLKDYILTYNGSHWCTAFGGSYSNQIYALSATP